MRSDHRQTRVVQFSVLSGLCACGAACFAFFVQPGERFAAVAHITWILPAVLGAIHLFQWRPLTALAYAFVGGMLAATLAMPVVVADGTQQARAKLLIPRDPSFRVAKVYWASDIQEGTNLGAWRELPPSRTQLEFLSTATLHVAQHQGYFISSTVWRFGPSATIRVLLDDQRSYWFAPNDLFDRQSRNGMPPRELVATLDVESVARRRQSPSPVE